MFSLTRHPEAASDPLWRWFFPLLALGFAARAAVGLVSDVPLHFDEVMQYLEQAHRIVFGYGIVPWEYREGTRSWLVPGFVAGILHGLRLVGLDRPTAYVPAVKLVFCAVSLLIPAGMYLFSRVNYGERTARVALVLGCFWYELVVFAHKPMTTFLATACFLAAMAFAAKVARPGCGSLAAALCTLALSVRMQIAPAVACLLAAVFIYSPARQRKWIVCGAAAVVVLVGLLDYLTWGGWWHSYLRNVELNLIRDVAAGFGTGPWYQYAVWLLLATGGLFYLALAWSFTRFREFDLLLTCLLTLILLHSLIGHKEYRFIFLVIPLWLTILAHMLATIGTRQSVALQALCAVVCVLGLTNHLPWQDRVYLAIGYTVQDFLDARSDRQAFLYLSNDDSVKGVIDLSSHWSISGGYYYLHREVPLYDRAMYLEHLQDQPAERFASHILTTDQVQSIPGFERGRTFSSENDGTLVLWNRQEGFNGTYTWESYILER